jgi:hypothetical protein
MRTKAAILPVAVACISALSVSGLTYAQPSESPEPTHALVDRIVVASDRRSDAASAGRQLRGLH